MQSATGGIMYTYSRPVIPKKFNKGNILKFCGA